MMILVNGERLSKMWLPKPETLEQCIETLQRHHNSTKSDSFGVVINKFDKMKSTCGKGIETKTIDFRHNITVHQSEVSSPLPVPYTLTDAKTCSIDDRIRAVNRLESLTAVGSKCIKKPFSASSEDAKRSKTQPITPALFVDALMPPSPYLGARTDHDDKKLISNIKLSPSSIMAGIFTGDTGLSEIESSASIETVKAPEIPVSARALPAPPTSLESFRSQLSKTKKEKAAKKKQAPVKKSDKTSTSVNGGNVSSGGGGSGKRSSSSKKKNTSKATKSLKCESKKYSEVQAEVPINHNYDLSEYFTSEEISGLLSVICSDDEADDVVIDHDISTVPGNENSGYADKLQNHVALSPHVNKTGAIFSFASKINDSNSQNSSMIMKPSDINEKKRKNESDANETSRNFLKKKVATSNHNSNGNLLTGDYDDRGQSKISNSKNEFLNPTSPNIQGLSLQNRPPRNDAVAPLANAKRSSACSNKINIGGGKNVTSNATFSKEESSKRAECFLSLEQQEKIAAYSEEVLKMQTEQIMRGSSSSIHCNGWNRESSNGSVPSLLSALSSSGNVYGANLQGLTGLSNMWHGEGMAMPSLPGTSMFWNSSYNNGQAIAGPITISQYQSPHVGNCAPIVPAQSHSMHAQSSENSLGRTHLHNYDKKI